MYHNIKMIKPENITFFEEIEFNNNKKILNEKINKWIKLSDKIKSKELIKKELEKKENLFKYDKKYYRDLIFFSKSENVINEIDLEIIFCKGNTKLNDIWKYFKIMSSSCVTGDNGIGCLKMMIRDKKSEKYLGILEISNDLLNIEDRDKFIGWNKNIQKDKINIDRENLSKARSSFLVNITCCIGLQPMAYNLNIGKLLVKTVFSREVFKHFYDNRGYYYAGVTTFGLYGKSIQYDRLKEIKYIGLTKGTGICDLSIDLKDEISNFVKIYYPNEYFRRSKMSSSKMRIIQFGLNQLEFNQDKILNHGNLRGIYFGFTTNQSKDFLNGKMNNFNINLDNIKTFNEIFQEWKNRWAIQRLNNLIINNRFKIAFELKDFTLKEKKNEYSKQYQYEKFSDEIYIKNKKEKNKNYYYENKDKILEKININLENFKKNDQYLYPEYLAGFFDSDGSIYISNDTLFINFTQCVLNVLILIQNEYGGTIFKNKKRSELHRICYNLRIVGIECNKILEILEKKSVLKIDRIKIAKQYLNFINKKKSDEKDLLIFNMKNLKKQDDNIYFDRINWKYIAGMFDGDGCITLNYNALYKNKLYSVFSICQKYTPNFLLYIKNFISNDINDTIRICKINIYTTKKDNIINIYERIKNFIIVKKYQFDCLKKIIYEYNKDNLNFDYIKELSYEMKNNKHKDVNYDLNILENNIISNITNNIINKIDNINEKEIKLYTHTKVIQGEKKMGLLNPNYGKEMSEDHKSKIGKSNSIKQREKWQITDEKIEKILELKDKKITQDKILEMFNLKNRNLITDIWNGVCVPSYHPNYGESHKKEIDYSKTHSQKTSEGKMTIPFNICYELIEWKKKRVNNEKMQNGENITDKNMIKLYPNYQLTVDKIKSLWMGKTKLYEEYFKDTKITYNEYLEISSIKLTKQKK